MKKHNEEQNSPEWLELRAKYRTASEAAIVMGKSPFTTIKDFKLIKAGLKKQFYSKAMKQGHDLEDKVRKWCNYEWGKEFKDEVWSTGKYLASLDGIADGTLVEIKVSDYTYNEIKDGKMPVSYYLQVQQQLLCSPAVEGYIVAYSPKADDYAVSAQIVQNPKFLADINKAWKAFDEMGIPDGPVDRTGDGEIHTLFGEYHAMKDEADRIAAAMSDIKNKLIIASGHNSITAGDFKLTKKVGAIRVDYKKAATDSGADLEKYKKVGAESYMITVPKNPFL